MEAARSIIGWLRSVAVIAADEPRRDDIARVATPVPAASSNTVAAQIGEAIAEIVGVRL
jgi:hypothetical protein